MVVICSQNGEWEHTLQSPDGWNGFATVAEYYNTFNAADTRAKYSTLPLLLAMEIQWISKQLQVVLPA
jgi:hypothetical protein